MVKTAIISIFIDFIFKNFVCGRKQKCQKKLLIARLASYPANIRKQHLYKESTVADVNSYTATSGRCMSGRVLLCKPRIISRSQLNKQRRRDDITYLYCLKCGFSDFLIGVIFEKFIFVLATSCTFFIHTTLAACF
jgi:hypothetical protein